MKKTRISFDVELDENKVPENIKWSAPDGGVSNEGSKALWNVSFIAKAAVAPAKNIAGES